MRWVAALPRTSHTRREVTIPNPTFAARYQAATERAGGACPIEAGMIARLADNECDHGRLPGDPTPACGCWPQETAQVLPLPARGKRTHRRAA